MAQGLCQGIGPLPPPPPPLCPCPEPRFPHPPVVTAAFLPHSQGLPHQGLHLAGYPLWPGMVLGIRDGGVSYEGVMEAGGARRQESWGESQFCPSSWVTSDSLWALLGLSFPMGWV